MRVDTHLHVWDRSQARYDWLEKAPLDLRRDFAFNDVAPHLDSTAIDRVILVQAADNADDTKSMLGVARANPRVAGVIGWLPIDEPEVVQRRIDSFQAEALLVGVRTLIHDRPDPDWIVRPEVLQGLAVLASRGIPYDYVTSHPRALVHLPEVARRNPSLPLVIDHLGSPPFGENSRAWEMWRSSLADAAQYPLVYAKISGMPAANRIARREVLQAVQTAADLFGPRRLMIGSDWPVSRIREGYDLADSIIPAVAQIFSKTELRAVEEGTAVRVYKLMNAI